MKEAERKKKRDIQKRLKELASGTLFEEHTFDFEFLTDLVSTREMHRWIC